MKTAFIAIAIVGAGIVGALAGEVLFPDSGADEPKAPEGPDKLASRVKAIEDGYAGLKDEIRLLRSALDRVEAEAAPAPAEMPAEVADVPEGSDPAAASSDENLKEKILDVVEEKAKADREEREKRWTAMAAQRETDRLNRLEKELGLNSYQKDELQRIFNTRREAMMKLREKYFGEDGRPDPDRMGLFREEMQQVRTESETQIQQILTPEQYETYSSQDRGGRGGFPGGGRGGGRGGR